MVSSIQAMPVAIAPLRTTFGYSPLTGTKLTMIPQSQPQAKLAIHQVDAFTDQPFCGNPAGVCVLATPAEETWMQTVAAEMNLSETGFLVPIDDGYQLRWFTPTAEVDLCGHGTLASAHVLWTEGYLAADQIARFQTKSGLLTAELNTGWITLDFPVKPVTAIAPPDALPAVIQNLTPVFVGASDTNYFVELETEAAVRSLQPDFGLLKTLPKQGLIVTSRAEAGEFDVVSRYFAPAIGIDEDPVTGSAHCSLTPYWQAKLGQQSLLAKQVSARGGVLKVTTAGDRVLISGQAVTVLQGVLMG
ncbi:MAG: PhzF family phenazine biosynthesis protein [Cyanobacteria bacterium J06639_16]